MGQSIEAVPPAVALQVITTSSRPSDQHTQYAALRMVCAVPPHIPTLHKTQARLILSWLPHWTDPLLLTLSVGCRPGPDPLAVTQPFQLTPQSLLTRPPLLTPASPRLTPVTLRSTPVTPGSTPGGTSVGPPPGQPGYRCQWPSLVAPRHIHVCRERRENGLVSDVPRTAEREGEERYSTCPGVEILRGREIISDAPDCGRQHLAELGEGLTIMSPKEWTDIV